MIIEVESVFGDVILHGNAVNLSELTRQVKTVISLVGEKNFVSALCSGYGYEIISDNIEHAVDYVVDLDTQMVYKPKY